MNSYIIFSTILAFATAAPSVLYQPAELIATAPLVQQYHSQDSLGQYHYGYSGGPSAKSEVRSLDGITRGSYSYIDADQKLQTVAYTADALGFRVAATNLPEAPKDMGVAPEPVQDTPEVVKARADHLALVEMGGVAPLPEVKLAQPEPVQETEEVAKARADHLEAVEQAKMSGPVDVKLEPVQETPEVAMARSEHLKAVEMAKTRNAIVEAIDNEPVKIISPTLISTPSVVAAPHFRFGLAEPTIQFGTPTKIQQVIAHGIEAPTVRLAAAAPALTEIKELKLETPAVQNIQGGSLIRFATPQLNELKWEAPVVQKLETPVLRFAGPTATQIAYPSAYAYTYSNNLIAPFNYAYEPARLIRSVQ